MTMTIDRSSLQRVIAVINGKGGVGKTTLTANIGGLLAASGWKVLLVDLDAQGSLGGDLGYKDTASDDKGEALSKALIYSSDVAQPLINVRPNLDVLVGGSHLEHASAALGSRSGQGQVVEARLSVTNLLSKIAADYDIVLMDCPPGGDIIQSAAVAAARYILVPVRQDRGSIDGLQKIAERLDTVIDLNPDIDLLGVILFGSLKSETAVRQAFRDKVTVALGGADHLIFPPFVRHSGGTAESSRDVGLLVHELEDRVRKAPKWYEQLRQGKPVERTGPASATDVAGDLQDITTELVNRIIENEAKEAAANV
jgi:chromosome partitioning protein